MKPLFDFNEPSSATPKEWRLWRARMKRERPIAWFFRMTLWREGIYFIWSVWVKRPIVDAWWAINYRVVPRYRYHVVRTGLTPGYHELSTRMLYACFALLAECVEHKIVSADWSEDEQGKRAWEELAVLYHWWREVRPGRRTLEVPELPGDMGYIGALFDEDNQHRAETAQWKEDVARQHELESHWAAEDEAMLSRLIAVRHYLWV